MVHTVEKLSNELDLIEIVKMLPKQLEEIGIEVEAPNPERMLKHLYISHTRGAIFVAKDGDAIVGVLALYPTEYWWSGEIFYTDLSFFVLPKYRKSSIGRRLLELGKEFCKGKNMTISLLSTEDNERKEKFFTRMGFTNIGGQFLIKG